VVTGKVAPSLRFLFPLAAKLGLNPLWITWDPDNIGSRRSCELAAAQFVQIVDEPEKCGTRGRGGRDEVY
jgi:predicted acetyltransferase